MTKRHLLSSLIFPLLKPADAHSADVEERSLTLHYRKRAEHIPLRYVESLELSYTLARSSVLVRHAAGKSTLSGLVPKEAVQLAETVHHARLRCWRRILDGEAATLQSLHTALHRLAQPNAYVTESVYQRILSTAEATLRNLEGHWPEALQASPIHDTVETLRALVAEPEQTLATANSHYIRRELAASKTFFDKIEYRPLTDEQRTAVVTDEHNNLVIASAGSGKTSVIIAKAAWLVSAGHHQASELLLLAFARDARNEMDHRLTTRMGESAHQGLTVRTFHSLGMSIMGDVEGRLPSLSSTADDPNALQGLLKEIVSDLIADPEHSRTLLAWLQNRHAPYKTEHDFANLGEYYAYIRQYDLRSLQGEKVRSFEECEIANFLFLNGIPYEYEAPYEHDTATRDRRQYRPDFHIADRDLYIEHFGIDMQGRTPPFVDRDRYLADRVWKRELHAAHGTTLIETFSHQHQHGTLQRTLANALADHGIKPAPITAEQVFDILEEQGRITPFIRLTSTFLHHYKSAGLTYAELSRRIDETRGRERAQAFLDIFKPIHEAYQRSLHEKDHIDFNDMIHCAASYVENGKYRSPFQYVLIDEFQDISPARARLVKALLRQSRGNRLFAVGDDWQAISRYAGADISIMRDFGKHFGNHRQLRLETTFRCPDRLANAATQFILKNPAQIPKTVRSPRKADAPCIYLGLSPNPGTPLVVEALERIREHTAAEDRDPNVLILARYNRILAEHTGLKKQFSPLQIGLKTVHASKGLEADYVILLGLTRGKYGFPTEIVDDPLLDLVLANPEPHSNAEERRLFYVALTRARRHVYLIGDGTNPSAFATELMHGGYDIAYFGRPPAPDVPCPVCVEGKMQPRNRPATRQIFYGCSNYPYCHHTSPPCPSCNTGLPVRTGNGVSCPNCGHDLTPCPRCTGWLRERTSKARAFLGCSNHPVCKHTQPLDRRSQPSSTSTAPTPRPGRARSPTPAANDPAASPSPTGERKSPQPPAPSPPPEAPPSPEPAAPAPTHRDSTPPQTPSDRDRPLPPLRIGDSVRFLGGGQALEGHLLQPRLAKKRAHVIDAEGSVWKVRDIDMTPAPDIPRRNVIITPANETRASLRPGDTVSFRTPLGPVQGTIVKLNPSRALVEAGEDTWNVLYLGLKPTPDDRTDKNRQHLHAVAAAARALMDRHGLSHWTLAFSESRTQLGQCVHPQRLIRISLQHALDATAQDIRDTVLHEIAHAIAGPGVGHGPAWKDIAAGIGATPAAKQNETGDTDHSQSPGQAM